MSNIYHILYKKPILTKYDMLCDLEEIATRIVESGRLRIDAYDKVNFVRCPLPNRSTTLMFSYRELNDKKLLRITHSILTKHLSNVFPKSQIIKQVDKRIVLMQKELQKYHYINLELEMKLARVLVQSAHPIVMMNIISDSTEIFISYSHEIGDLLDMQSWQEQGRNSGMQSIDNQSTAIFVSCGGDPFGDWDGVRIYGDGNPALARMMVIAGQEIGHYADIVKNANHITRYSCTYYPYYHANHKVNNARLRDLDNVDILSNLLNDMFLFRAISELERSILFYIKVKQKRMLRYMLCLIRSIKLNILKLQVQNSDLSFTCAYGHKNNGITLINMALVDMKLNLEPNADVYKHVNPDIETAIICAEALARVPQQVNKWGHEVTQSMTPNLYQIYYGTVISDAITYYESQSKLKYKYPDGSICRGNFRETCIYYYNKVKNVVLRKSKFDHLSFIMKSRK